MDQRLISSPAFNHPLREKALAILGHAAQEGECKICWLTPSQTYANVKGYGRVHRLIYEVIKGPIPAGMLVCHTCDTPRCINPLHLFLGSAADNMQDKVNKGRQHFGGPGKILDTEKVRLAHELYHKHGFTYTEIGDEFGVSRRTIARAISFYQGD